MSNIPPMLCVDGSDEIMKHWQAGTGGVWIDRKEVCSKVKDSPWPIEVPVSFRSMTKRKEIWKCWDVGRPFYYIDNGYMGNLEKRKLYYRVVKNNIQHFKPRLDMQPDRYYELCRFAPYMQYNGRKPKENQNGAILIVTPSDKPCAFYNVDKNTWLQQTIDELKQHTDRPIMVREKGLRPDRIRDKSVAGQCAKDQIYAVVTYQSMAALEAIHYGIPAFATAPTCVETVVNKDLSQIENPTYPEKGHFEKILHWLAYCQYTLHEMANGTALHMIERYKLYD
tara:strand:+ start:51 stop:893 length:843 start_codon:yes stop_codon:yes gene_type:complete